MRRSFAPSQSSYDIQRGWDCLPEQPPYLLEDLCSARDSAMNIRELSGPHLPAISDVLTDARSKLLDINPLLQPEIYFDFIYQSDATRGKVEQLMRHDPENFYKLREAKTHKDKRFNALGSLHAKEHVTHPFQLQGTPFHYQGEDLDRAQAATLCTSTSFRMVHEAISGERISEAAMYYGLRLTHQAAVIPDESLLGVFSLPAYQQRHNQQISVMTITGGSLSFIGKIATKFYDRVPDGSIYGILNIQSEAREHVWHSNVLLAGDNLSVTVHDPKFDRPQESRTIPRESFERRWAHALNRAHLIMTRPITD